VRIGPASSGRSSNCKACEKVLVSGKPKKRQANWLSFFNNVYWARAWIRQEIFLAKSIHMLAQETVITRATMSGLALLFPLLKSLAIAPTRQAETEHCKDMALAWSYTCGSWWAIGIKARETRTMSETTFSISRGSSEAESDRFHAIQSIPCAPLLRTAKISQWITEPQICNALYKYCAL
jgi:hypothetical protein